MPASDLPSARVVRARDGVFEVPSSLIGARIAPPWLAVGGAALVVVVAALSVVLSLTRGDGGAEPVPTAVRSATRTPAAPGAAPGAPDATTFVDRAGARQDIGPTGVPGRPGAVGPSPMPTDGAAPPTQLTVHVIGQVAREGVVRVPAGSRVTDVIAKAGGPTRKAVMSGLNLARPVVDGEQILVPDRAGAPVPVNTFPPPAGQPGAVQSDGGGAGAGSPLGGAGSLVDLNTADEATLDTLPGVGPVLARKIVEWRTAHGRFTTVEELGEVDGVGEKKLASIRPRVRV